MKEKRRKITLKKGGKGLKNASFGAMNSPTANIFVGGKKIISKEGGGGNYQNAQYISLPLLLTQLQLTSFMPSYTTLVLSIIQGHLYELYEVQRF